MKKYSVLIAITAMFHLFSGCNLDEFSITEIDKNALFSSEEGLAVYSVSFYDFLPDATEMAVVEQYLADFGCTLGIGDPFTVRNAFSENNSGGWDWGRLRNFNYFIVNCTDPAVPEDVRNNYIGLARFFRALFYYDKVARFGDVPWVDRPLSPQIEEDEAILYGPRHSREFVMEKVYEDLMFAAEHITRTNDAIQSTLVTKWAAYAIASRVCLFEGTFRKYHELDLPTTAETWLERAADAASEVMRRSGKSLNGNYRDLFTSDVPPANETILAIASSAELGQRHSGQWDWSSETKGSGLNLIRPFVCTYLQRDGTPYTNRPDWQYEDFYDEFQNRDLRLNATLRHPGYRRSNNIALPVFNGYARLGYQPIKLCIDDVGSHDSQSHSTHAIQYIRYAEVLLNYAEAKAELGTLTDAEWSATIGALRQRAGITGSINAKPTVVDEYLKNTYFPDISDPVILEIRRERAIELIFEGFRFNDLKRWKRGELLTMAWTGMYIPNVNVPLDVDRDGTYDIIYYTTTEGLNAGLTIAGNQNLPRVQVSLTSGDMVHIIPVDPADHSKGYNLAWFTHRQNDRVWGQKQYLYPIPIGALNRNGELGQNPGWRNGATNDGN